MNVKQLSKVRDFKGQRLCEPCWNNVHFIHDQTIKAKISNCNRVLENGEPCECECANLAPNMKELNQKAKARAKAEREAQQSLCERPQLTPVETGRKPSAVDL